jgi:hypothetical protein
MRCDEMRCDEAVVEILFDRKVTYHFEYEINCYNAKQLQQQVTHAQPKSGGDERRELERNQTQRTWTE